MEQLKNRISVFVPSTYEGNKPAKRMQKKAVKHAAKYLCKYFGGSTAQEAQGFWNSPEKGLIAEKQVIVFAQCTNTDLQANREKVFNMAKALCRWMKQEAVTVTVNDEMYFVEA